MALEACAAESGGQGERPATCSRRMRARSRPAHRGLAMPHRLNACGYSLGARFTLSWMDAPMFYEANPVRTRLSDPCLLPPHDLDGQRCCIQTALCLGRTYLVGADGAESLNASDLDLMSGKPASTKAPTGRWSRLRSGLVGRWQATSGRVFARGFSARVRARRSPGLAACTSKRRTTRRRTVRRGADAGASADRTTRGRRSGVRHPSRSSPSRARPKRATARCLQDLARVKPRRGR